jgi:hypothetical protein
MTNAEICKAGTDEQGCYLWHWHISTMRELERLAAIGETVTNHVALAGNLKSHSGDVYNWLNDLMRAGLVAETTPAWEFDATWVTLTSVSAEVDC